MGVNIRLLNGAFRASAQGCRANMCEHGFAFLNIGEKESYMRVRSPKDVAFEKQLFNIPIPDIPDSISPTSCLGRTILPTDPHYFPSYPLAQAAHCSALNFQSHCRMSRRLKLMSAGPHGLILLIIYASASNAASDLEKSSDLERFEQCRQDVVNIALGNEVRGVNNQTLSRFIFQDHIPHFDNSIPRGIRGTDYITLTYEGGSTRSSHILSFFYFQRLAITRSLQGL